MRINSNIFKANDVRGIYPKELNEETAYLIGRAFVKFLKTRPTCWPGLVRRRLKLNIVVGSDNRLSTPKLKKSLIKGIIEEGADVIDVGLATTPMFYFAVFHNHYDAGIMITASHNPPEYNGLKFVREEAIPVAENSGLKEIRKIARKLAVQLPTPLLTKEIAGKIKKEEVLSEYLKFNLNYLSPEKIKPLRIVIDTGNGMAGIVVVKIFKKLPLKVFHLFSELDGNFPNHLPDPSVKENLAILEKEVKNKKADLGVVFDGDGDRIVFVDEKGKFIPPDLITALIAELILRNKAGEKIIYEICSSNIVRDVVQRRGGKPIIWKVGHSLLKEKIRKENIIFGGETSGHYFLRENYFSEAPFFVLFKILEEISQGGKKISELILPYKKYCRSESVNIKIEKAKNIKKILQKLEKHFGKGSISHLDGLRIDFSDWWFSARASHTEPVLRVVVEARTKKEMEEKKKEILNILTF